MALACAGTTATGTSGRLKSRQCLLFPVARVNIRTAAFFIVVNRDPIGSQLLLLTIVTSNVADARIRNRNRLQTIVEITPAEYREFKVHSVVDCNVVLEKPLSELSGMVRRNEVRYHRDLPVEIFALASPLVADELKQIL